MRFRCISLFVLVFQALWLNVIIPGHQRGIVQLQTVGGKSVPSCCCAADDKPADGKPLTSEQRAKNCAVCFFSAHISLPPVIAFDHAPLGLLQRLRPDQRDDLFARIVLVPFDSCGPPAIA